MQAVDQPTPTSVYRYYDKFGTLLYVGITSRGPRRNDEHNEKAWWPFVAWQTIEHFPRRHLALAREEELIAKQRPPFNQQHNPGHALQHATYLSSMTTMGVQIRSMDDMLREMAQDFATHHRATFEQLGEAADLILRLREEVNADLFIDAVDVVERLGPVYAVIRRARNIIRSAGGVED